MHDLICPNSGPMWQVLSNSHVTEKRSERSSDLFKLSQLKNTRGVALALIFTLQIQWFLPQNQSSLSNIFLKCHEL